MIRNKEDLFALPESDVHVHREEIDNILYTAFNAGGISGWADRFHAPGLLIGERFYQVVARGRPVMIHNMVDGKDYELNIEKLLKAIKTYTFGGHWIREDGWFPRLIDRNDANYIVQIAVFGEVRYS